MAPTLRGGPEHGTPPGTERRVGPRMPHPVRATSTPSPHRTPMVESTKKRGGHQMTRKRMLVAGAVAVVALGVGGGVAVAQDAPDARPGPPAGAGPHGDVDRDAWREEMR